ncbi:MAG TPA: V-type ATPase subunit [Bacillota bacterium]|nr:V-type ATPase subunit [Bacillota bacterium]
MRERNYTYAVARIRSLETKLLDNAQMERLANATTLSEALAYLGETEYGAVLANLKNPHQFEDALNQELNRVIRLVMSLSEDAPELRAFIYRYDIENIKKILKSESSTADRLSNLGQWSPSWLVETMAAERYAEFPSELAEAIIVARRLYKENGDVQEIDRILDQAYFEIGYHLLKNGISELFFKWWIAMIDLTNLRTFVRMRLIGLAFAEYQRFFINYGKLTLDQFQELWDQPDEKVLSWLGTTPYDNLASNGAEVLSSLTVLEREYDNYLTRMIADAKYISLGVEPLAGYLIAKEIECKTLRIILVGKVNNVSIIKLKERLRRAYA